ncbi:hypothetical protein AB0F77_20215 [Streptomyces sp. NPDC026672]|uniref:hypothetical protein n=1 Tax=unclassified Streptomyces TaxID=2593676 RepID=UPI0033F258B6
MSDKSSGSLSQEGAALAGEVAAYLLVRAERDQAQREAELLCSRLPWLTTAQTEDVVRRYVEQHLLSTAQATHTDAARAHRLRTEYERRYLTLRRTLLKLHAAYASALLVCAAAAVTAGELVTR